MEPDIQISAAAVGAIVVVGDTEGASVGDTEGASVGRGEGPVDGLSEDIKKASSSASGTQSALSLLAHIQNLRRQHWLSPGQSEAPKHFVKC